MLHACRGAAASTGGMRKIRQGRPLGTARFCRRGLLRGAVGVIVTAGWPWGSRTGARRVQHRPACRTISYRSQFWDTTLKQPSHWLDRCRRPSTAGHATTASFRRLDHRCTPVTDNANFLQLGPFADIRKQCPSALRFISVQLRRGCVCLAKSGGRRGSTWGWRGRNGHLGSVSGVCS